MDKETIKNINEEKNPKLESKVVEENKLNEVAGGYPGHDKFSASEYAKAGVIWHHHLFKKDEYICFGYKITQDAAEFITESYYTYGVHVTEEDAKMYATWT